MTKNKYKQIIIQTQIRSLELQMKISICCYVHNDMNSLKEQCSRICGCSKQDTGQNSRGHAENKGINDADKRHGSESFSPIWKTSFGNRSKIPIHKYTLFFLNPDKPATSIPIPTLLYFR